MHSHRGSADLLNSNRRTRLAIVIVANLGIVASQAVFGFIAGSLGLIADAGHNLTDVAAVSLSLLAVIWSQSAADDSRTYGLHRTGILAALANAALILAITVFIFYEGIRRLMEPEAVKGWIVVAVAGIGFVANSLSALLLRDGEDDINMRSSVLHMTGDAAASLGVVVAGAVILVSGRFYWLDPLVAMAIGVLISWQAWKLGREALLVLLEGSPKDVDVSNVRRHILETEGVQSVHDLHVWSMTSGLPMMSAHVVLRPGASPPDVLEALHTCLDEHFEVEHCTIQLEATDRSAVERVKH